MIVSTTVRLVTGIELTRLSFRVMSVRRAGISVSGDKREVVVVAERRAGRNNALPERKDMVEVWMLDLPGAT